ncbi:MAG TPA: ABC transporter ATP-binding protein [Rectinemataceae bacterium]|nr:ABC transporter ATP-binding protein [Rectinemataceae bacterium]
MKALFRLFSYLRKDTRTLVLALFLLILSSALGVIQPRITEWIIDSGIRRGVAEVVWAGAAAILAAGIVAAVTGFASSRLTISAAQDMSYALRNDLYRKASGLSFSTLDRYRTGELIVRLNSDVNTVRMFVRMGLLVVVQAVVLIAGSIGMMFTTDRRLATIMAIFMPAVMLLFLFVASFVKPLFMKVRTAMDNFNNVVQENLAGAKTVRAFARRDAERRRFALRNGELNRISFRVGASLSTLFPLFFLFAQGAVLITLWIGGTQIIAQAERGVVGGLSLGQLVAFNNYAMMAMFPILMLGFVINFISMAAASAERLQRLLAERSELTEKPAAARPERLRGRIEFCGVSFRYGDGRAAGAPGGAEAGRSGSENALRGIDLAIGEGERLGLIGTTGAGKSTLISLVPRFYDPVEGSVLVDGRDLGDYALDSLRRRVCLAFQDTVLFTGTIRDNVAFGRPGAKAAELERAVRIAAAEEFVAEKGWDSILGERGAGLSGGQRQRLAIARAVAADPDILIFDDVTSSLDAETEARVIEALFSELGGKTMILVSQKASAVRRADRIVVMDDGAVSGIGSHEELYRDNGIYRGICETQGVSA